MNTSNRYYDSSGGKNDIRPGKISAELREALNIAENDLPIWIYRMRALGYPPGWLSKAIVDTNDIFDTDAFGEDGNLKRGAPSEKIQYDHSKLIEYPGFNTPMPPNCVDYHFYINMPPMLEHQQLEYAKKQMSSHTEEQPQKRARLSSPTNEASTSNQPSSSNQPSTSNDPPTSNESSISYVEPPVKRAPEVIVISDEEEGEDSEVRDADKNTTAEVTESKNNTLSTDDRSHEESYDSSEPQIIESKDNKTPHKQESLTKQDEKVEDKPSITPKIDSPLTEGIKLVSRGTPMPTRVKRAPLEKFSEGVVGELLYFENTPTSSGKFDSIKGLLNDIRKSKNDSNTSF